MIQTRIKKPAMEPMTMPAMAPPVRVLAPSGSLLSLFAEPLVSVRTVTVAVGEVVVAWRLRR
jgi:hypothetical protein